MDPWFIPIIGATALLFYVTAFYSFWNIKTLGETRSGWVFMLAFLAMGTQKTSVFWDAVSDPSRSRPEPLSVWLSLGIAHLLFFGVVGFTRILREKRKNESNLRETELFLARAQQVARVGSFRIDLRTGVWECSKTMLEIFGADESYRHDLQGWLQRVHPDQREEMRDHLLREVIGRRQPFDRDYRIVRYDDGQVRWVRGTGLLDLDAAGIPVSMVGTLQDITEHKDSESALKESEERFRSLAESLPQAVFECDLEGRFTYANPTAHRMFGYGEGDVGRGIFVADVVVPEERPRAVQNMRKILDGSSQTKGNEYTALRKDGSTFPITIYTNFKRQAEKVTGAIGIVVDNTEAKRGEAERHQLQVQFFQAQKMESIGTLAGGIAHDFNNMLGGILGSLSIMELDSKGDPGRKREVEEMKALVKRGAGMTRQLLGFAHRGHYEAKPLDLIDVVDKTLELYHRTRKDVVLQTEFPDDDVNIMGDPSQVEQVMMNLFVNAGQAMPRGGVLSVRLEKVEPTLEVREPLGILPGPFAQVTVRDTGVGMDKPTLDRIFEPFFTTKGAGTGTGLGLASVYGIVKNHGGFVQVESRPGKGTTFAVYLPVTDRIPVAEETPGSCPVWFRDEDKRTILLVDDEEPILRTCTKTLQAIGFEVHSARNGREALEIFKARKDQVSVVILDMVMPGMSGWDTFEALKMLDPKVKVLLASGYIREGHAALEMETGTHGFIEKPFDLETLSVKLKELI